MRGRNLWWGSRIFSLLGGKRKRRIGRIRSITIPFRSRFNFFYPKFLIRIDQANLSFVIYAYFEKDPLVSTSGMTFLMYFNIEYFVMVFGLPRCPLPWHTADNNFAAILSLNILMIFLRKLNVLFTICNSTCLILLNLIIPTNS